MNCTVSLLTAGMFIIIAALLAINSMSEAASENILGFFDPALSWIQRWLPLFYVPTLVVLPLSIQGIAGMHTQPQTWLPFGATCDIDA